MWKVVRQRREEGSGFEMSESHIERAGASVDAHDNEDNAGVCKYALGGVCIEGGIDASGLHKRPHVMILA